MTALLPKLLFCLAGMSSSFLMLGCGSEEEVKGCVGFGCSDKSDFAGDPALLSCADPEAALGNEIRVLLADITNGSRDDISKVSDLLAALPEEARRNVIFMTDTRSMARIYPSDEKDRQLTASEDSADYSFHSEGGKWCSSNQGSESCVESRVLFASPEGDFIGSFTTHPDSPSSDRFEMILFDPELSETALFDIDFRDSRPVVDKNPDSCMGCHQGRDGTINFRLDSYRMWAYATPYKEDFLEEGSIESEWYLSFLDRMEAGEDKLGQMLPASTRALLEESFAEQGYYQVPAPEASINFQGINTPLLNLHHQLLEKNACRGVAAMAQRDDFDSIKYAAMGALRDCSNIEDFLPTFGWGTGRATKGHAKDFFEAMGEGLDASGDFSVSALLAETNQRHDSITSDKLSRRYNHLAEFVGPQLAAQEIEESLSSGVSDSQYGLTTFENSSSPITKARYLLEPLGVDVTSWSMAVDRGSQSHVEFFNLFGRHAMFRDLKDTEFPNVAAYSNEECEALAERSREELSRYVPAEDGFEDELYNLDDLEAIKTDARNVVASEDLHVAIRTEAAKVYNTCNGCHTYTYSTGTPKFRFDSIASVEDMYARDSRAKLREMDGRALAGTPFKYIGVADRMWDRVNRHRRQPGMMPRFGTPLTRGQKIMLYAHMILSGVQE